MVRASRSMTTRYGRAGRNFLTGRVVFHLVLKTGNFYLAIALVQFPILVVRLGVRRWRNALGLVDLCVDRVFCRRHPLHRQRDVAVGANQLHPAQCAGPHHDSVRNPAGAVNVGRSVADDQILGVDRRNNRAPLDRVVVALFEGNAGEPQHQQHAVGIRVILFRRFRQVMIEVFFECLGEAI